MSEPMLQILKPASLILGAVFAFQAVAATIFMSVDEALIEAGLRRTAMAVTLLWAAIAGAMIWWGLS